MPGRATERRSPRASLAVVALLLSIPLPAGAAQPADLEALMALLGRVQRVEVSYTETVESGLIDTALSTRGRLVYESPDRIRRISDDNRGFVLEGDRMQLISDGRVVKELAVSDVAQLQAMVGALRATFAGDLESLRRDYRLEYRPGATQWTLGLSPLAQGLSSLYRGIEMLGDRATIGSIVLEESNGDRRTLRMRLLLREPPGLE